MLDRPDYIESAEVVRIDTVPVTRTIINDSGVNPLFADFSKVGVNQKCWGKLFPTSIRGHVYLIQVYLKNLAATSKGIVFCFRGDPTDPIAFKKTVYVDPLSEGWFTCEVDEYWDYPSLFVHNSDGESDENLRIGYDVVESPDCLMSGDGYSTWAFYDRRIWIRLNMKIQARYPLPVDVHSLDVALSTRARLQPWYQPNFAVFTRTWFGSGLAPHSWTQRWQYTTPANRLALVACSSALMMRVTTATVAAIAAVQILDRNSGQFPELQEIKTEVGVPSAFHLPHNIIATAGGTITGRSYDGSTGGTYNYVISAQIWEFNI